MASVFVVRIPGWRTFVIHVPDGREFIDTASIYLRRKFRTRIFHEIGQGNDKEVLHLATKWRLLRSRGEWGESPLVAAIAKGRSELACELILRGGSFANDGALCHAAMCGDVLVVKALLAAGKNPNEPLPNDDYCRGYTPLMWATNRNYHAVMEVLLASNASVNARADDGTTAVMLTREGKPDDVKALEILCRYKPDITLKDWRGRNFIREALDRERNSSNPELRRVLARYLPEVDLKENP